MNDGIHNPDGMRVAIPDYWPDVSGIGSISTIDMTRDEKEAERQRRRIRRQNGQEHPIGFAPTEERP